MIRSLRLLTILLVLLAACTPAVSTATSTPAFGGRVGGTRQANFGGRLTGTPPAGPGAQAPAAAPGSDAPAAPTPVPPSATPAPSATPVPSATLTATPESCDQAVFAGNVTIPDGTGIIKGDSFIKTWRIKNNGPCTWSTGYSLVWVNGSRLGAPAAVNLPAEVKPGSMVEVSVPMAAPLEGGSYTGYWFLRNDRNEAFGLGLNHDQPLIVTISVRLVSSITPGPSPTPRPTRPSGPPGPHP